MSGYQRATRQLRDPAVIAKRAATRRASNAAKRAEHRSESKECVRCGATFHPPANKVDTKAWDKRQFCGRVCSARGVMERPEVKVVQARRTRERFNDPDYRVRHAAAAAQNARKAHNFSDRAKAGRTRSERITGWIPADLLTRYVRLRERFGAEAAKVQIRSEIESRRLISLNPDLAAAHLRRITSVYRCNAAGKIDPVGTHWRYGTRVLERQALIKLAIDKGVDPERLVA